MSRAAPARTDLLRGLDLDAALTHALSDVGPELAGLAVAVLVTGPDGLGLRRSAGLAAGDDGRLASWAKTERDLVDRPFAREDVQEIAGLHGLTSVDGSPLGSLQSRPLRYRNVPLGALVALVRSGRQIDERQAAGIKLLASSLVTALVAGEAAERLAAASGAQVSGLPGVQELHATLDRELDRARRYGQRFGVVLLELARPEGSTPGPEDRVAREAAEEIGRQCRVSDFPFHLGGDSFALVLPQAAGAGAEKLWERLNTAVSMMPGATGLTRGTAIHRPGDDKEQILLRANADLKGAPEPAPAEAPPPPEPDAEPGAASAPATPAATAAASAVAAPAGFSLLPGIDYYAALRVDRGATQPQITHAYRDLSYRYRTAHREGDRRASERFRVVTEAYRVLADPDSRARYDRQVPKQAERERRISEVLRRPSPPASIAKDARRLAERLGDDHGECSGGDLEKVLKAVDAARAAAPDDPLVGEAVARVAPAKRYREGLDHGSARVVLEQVASGLGA